MNALDVQHENDLQEPSLPSENRKIDDEFLGKEMIRLWLLRLLSNPLGFEKLAGRESAGGGVVTCLGGLDRTESFAVKDYEVEAEKIADVLKALPSQLLEAEAKACNDLPQTITKNVRMLAHLLDLSVIEESLLSAIVMSFQHFHFRLALSALVLGDPWEAKQLYAEMVGADPEEMRMALSPHGKLIRCGLLVPSHPHPNFPSYKLSLLSDYFGERMLFPSTSVIDLLADHIKSPPDTLLTDDDFSHIGHELGLVQSLLESSLRTKHIGCNILIYGEPGTGKTELVRLVAKKLAYDLYDISCVDTEGQAIKGLDRLQAYLATQNLLAGASALIVFDELEDVFNDSENIFGRSTAQLHKGRITRLLEENQCPTFWISNQFECLDPAFIRRFDMVLELPIPPYEQREKMVKPIAAALELSTEHARLISLCPNISPAVLDRSAASIKRMHLSKEPAAKALDYLINSTLKAQHHKPMATIAETLNASNFDPTMTNIEGFESESSLVDFAERVVRLGQGILCLHGPSGSGKTAFARWLASKSDRSLCLVSGSDLISPLVGETEKKIAQMFKRAEQDGTIVLIDEADSFLLSRERAIRSWEITSVNEMLVQIERFSGILMMTTNHFSSLDSAALRRIDAKLTFDYLKPKQSWQKLQQFCESLGISQCEDRLEAAIGELSNLTAGDFATLKRRNGLLPLLSADAVVRALRAECGLKTNAPKRPMGFVG